MVKTLIKLDPNFTADNSESVTASVFQDDKHIADLYFDFRDSMRTRIELEALNDSVISHVLLTSYACVASDMIDAFFDDEARPDDYDFYVREI